jgi:hypothetical protein
MKERKRKQAKKSPNLNNKNQSKLLYLLFIFDSSLNNCLKKNNHSRFVLSGSEYVGNCRISLSSPCVSFINTCYTLF